MKENEVTGLSTRIGADEISLTIDMYVDRLMYGNQDDVEKLVNDATTFINLLGRLFAEFSKNVISEIEACHRKLGLSD